MTFCLYTILSIYHFVRTILSATILSSHRIHRSPHVPGTSFQFFQGGTPNFAGQRCENLLKLFSSHFFPNSNFLHNSITSSTFTFFAPFWLFHLVLINSRLQFLISLRKFRGKMSPAPNEVPDVHEQDVWTSAFWAPAFGRAETLAQDSNHMKTSISAEYFFINPKCRL